MTRTRRRPRRAIRLRTATLAGVLLLLVISVVFRNPHFGNKYMNAVMLWRGAHLGTGDGTRYDFPATGDFLLLESEEWDATIDVRYVTSAGTSKLDRFAILVDERVVEVTRDGVFIDGEPQATGEGTRVPLGMGAVLTCDQLIVTMCDIYWDGRDGGVFSWTSGRFFSFSARPPEWATDLRGLTGHTDGDPSNDFRLKDGTQLPAELTRAEFDRFADSWRIEPGRSLFRSAPTTPE